MLVLLALIVLSRFVAAACLILFYQQLFANKTDVVHRLSFSRIWKVCSPALHEKQPRLSPTCAEPALCASRKSNVEVTEAISSGSAVEL